MKKLYFFLMLLIPFTNPFPVYAHAFGQLYTLPLPAWLYIYGGGAAVILSFLLIGWFIGQSKEHHDYPRIELSKYFPFSLLTSKVFYVILQVASLSIFFITILAGIIGNQILNVAPYIFWIIFLLGITYLSAILGNIWGFINPAKIIARVIIRFVHIKKSFFTYPKRLGYIPACIAYFLLIYLELMPGSIAAQPKNLVIIILGYSTWTILGIILFGVNDWLTYGDFFSVFFGLLSKIAPIEYKEKKIYLRPPFIGLLQDSMTHFSLLLFILFMLASTAFDGFRSTSTFTNVETITTVYTSSLFGNYSELANQTILLILAPLLFLFFYMFAITIMKIITGNNFTLKQLSLQFAFTLIPIALAYNIAHYYTLLFIQGQVAIRLISDPFNKGWDLFGTANFIPNIALLPMNFIWNSEVAAIIIGHIAAVYLAHLAALQMFTHHKKAIISQIPMLLLMVLYTMTGLWILSQPMINR